MGFNWYVVRTEPRAEFLASDELRREGVEVFFPRFKSVHPKFGTVETPLFPGYLFLRCDPDGAGWPKLQIARHIAGWVTFGFERPWLPDYVVSELMEQWETIKQQGGNIRRFSVGDKVNITAGSLRGLAEILQEAKLPNVRARVKLQFMGRLVEAQVPWEYVESAESDPAPDQENRRLRRTRGKGRRIRGVPAMELTTS